MNNEPIMREILTKAVCGRGQMLQQNVVNFDITSPAEVQILGNYVTNGKINKSTPINLTNNKNMVRVEGQYDLHVWYAAGQDTNSIKKTVNYIETIPIKTYSGETFTDSQATANINSRPKCKKAYVTEKGQIKSLNFQIEQGLTVEVIGLTKLYVKALLGTPKTHEKIKGVELVPPTKTEIEYYPSDEFFEDDETK